MIVDRYVAHGLQANPFAVGSQGTGAQFFFVERDLPDPPLASSCTLVQVIGDKGAGKSTQLECWRRRAPGPYHYVPPRPYRSRWARPPVEQRVYADEIDRMPALLRWRWMRKLASKGATVIAGTHVDLESAAKRAGLCVVTHRLGPADLATVRAVLSERVRRAAVHGIAAPAFELTEAEMVDIHQRCDGSLRNAEILAHEVVARRVRAEEQVSSSLVARATRS